MIMSRSESGSVHATLEIDEKNIGALYLTEDELSGFTKVITTGSYEHDVVLSVEDSLDCNQEIDDDPWDD